jgi:Mg2+/Co2+ transporter CorB
METMPNLGAIPHDGSIPWIALAAALLLIALSAFFAGAVTALIGVSRSRLHQHEQEGNRRARLGDRLCEGIATITLRLFGSTIRTASMGTSAEELRGAIELHRGEETTEEEEVRHERAMLRSILELNEVPVSDIMTHRRNLVTIDAGQQPAQIVDEVLASPYTRLPLWKDNPDNIVGVLHAKALLREVRAHGGQLDPLDVVALAAQPWFIPDTTTLLDQLQAFRERREHFALVVDEYGSLMGVVTLEDILEEIVGDISDELDVNVAGVKPQPNDSYIIDGWVTIRDLNREFEWRLPDDKASTIAGLVLHEARKIPDVGQVFTFYGFRFEILRRQRHQIATLRVTPPSEET